MPKSLTGCCCFVCLYLCHLAAKFRYYGFIVIFLLNPTIISCYYILRVIEKESNIKEALDLCVEAGGELMPVSKLKYFVEDGVEPSKFPGYQTGLYRVNALGNGKLQIDCNFSP